MKTLGVRALEKARSVFGAGQDIKSSGVWVDDRGRRDANFR
jgi:hypothetical protein